MVYVFAEHTQEMKEDLSADELNVARSYWPLKYKRPLNEYQKKAMELAWRNKFTIIQGPPGTLHITSGYVLAVVTERKRCSRKTATVD